MLNILLLCNKPNLGNDANTIIDHIDSIEQYSKNRVYLYSNLSDLPKKLDLNKFDVVLIHYSLCLLFNTYLSKKSKKRIRKYNGLKVAFVQDEYRQINKMIDELQFLDIDVLFTCFPDNEKDRIYSKEKLPNISTYSNLTGYIPERLTQIVNQKCIKDRTISVGYRGRKIPYWLGELAYEKWSIVDKWLTHTAESELTMDLSYHEKDRIYGKDWIEFLSSCKTTLGVESGASVMDFTGELQKNIEKHQLLCPNESFTEVQKKYLLAHESKYKLNQISPRCFEAIALKTVLVLYEGEYSGILSPGRHYIELKKDFSNINEVLHKIQDDDFLQQMADRAFNEIALNRNFSYQSFIEYVDEVLEREFLKRNKPSVKSSYGQNEYSRIIYINRYKKISLTIKKRWNNLVYLCFRPSEFISWIKKKLFKIKPIEFYYRKKKL